MGVAAWIDTTPVDPATTAAIELAEMRAWADVYAAAPAAWAESVGLGTREVGRALAISWAATERRYFSRVIGLGVTEPATEAAIDEILRGYDEAGITMFLLQSMPDCRPAEYERWLRDRGLEPFDAQDRVYRDGSPAEILPPGAVEKVTTETAREWEEFMQRTYRLDTDHWLERLIGRPGWHQYVYRDGSTIVAARGMFIGPDGLAWLGMDGPVPGVMTDDYEPDAELCAFMVADGLEHGARGFLADIELPSPDLDTPAYRYFGELGFMRPYVRTHWTKPEADN
jgi:hypothetical protein